MKTLKKRDKSTDMFLVVDIVHTIVNKIFIVPQFRRNHIDIHLYTEYSKSQLTVM